MNTSNIYKNYYFRSYKTRLFIHMALWGLFVLSLVLPACSPIENVRGKKPCTVGGNLGGEILRDPEIKFVEGVQEGTSKTSECEAPRESEETTTGDTPYKEVQAPDSFFEDPTPSPFVDIIFEREKIDEKLFVSYVKAGDLVTLHITGGLQKEPQFSALYNKRVAVSWVDKRCYGFSTIGRSPRRCREVPHLGTCTASYRDYLGEVTSPISFKDLEDIPLVLTMGDREYELESVEFYEDLSVSVSFEIEEDMIQETQQLFIKPVVALKDDVKVGWVGYGHCPQAGKKGFNMGKAAFSTTMPHEIRREFEVSLKIMRSEIEEAVHEKALDQEGSGYE